MLSDLAQTEIKELMARYPQRLSALLPALYVAQREAGWLPAAALQDVAQLFGLMPAEVEEVASFYSMFNLHPVGEYHLEVCTNVPCQLRGATGCANQLKQALGVDYGETTPDGKFTLDHMECLGACGTAPMFMATERATGKIRYFEELDAAEKVEQALGLIGSGQGFETCERYPAGPYRHGGMEPRYLLANVDKPDSHTIEVYIRDGGYETAHLALTTKTPKEVLEEVKAANVRGRGGAGFPAGVKWGFLPAGVYPRYLVVNADESEPGTFKDRMIMEYDPHQLIEGIILAAYAVECKQAFIYIRGEYYFATTRLLQAIAEAGARGFLGKGQFGTANELDIIVHRGAGAYECGEETALLSSLEGGRGHPRLKPPFPAVEGLYRKPTVVNNVETICNVPHVIRHGAAWYKQFGTEKSSGFRIFCLSGWVKRPGLYELPHATTLRELIYTYGGGTPDDRPVKAVVPGGLSMKLLTETQLDTPLDYESIQGAGSMLGSAGVIVIGEGQSLVEVARRTLSFYREESCGKCTPCREGTSWLEKILIRIEAGEGNLSDLDLARSITNFVAGGRAFCPFGDAAVWGLQSHLDKFRPEFEQYIREKNPGLDRPEMPLRPTYRPSTNAAELD
ncbi:MAG: NADH-quinone oxidoreductase subunit NuoF [Anaerolineae bacterium]